MLCFAGLRIPTGLKNALMDIIRAIGAHPDTKPMDAAMIHCTVAFYGKVSHQRKVEIRKQVAALDPPPPGDVTIVGLDQFPDKKRNLVVARLAVPDEWMRARDEFVAASGGERRRRPRAVGPARDAGQAAAPRAIPSRPNPPPTPNPL